MTIDIRHKVWCNLGPLAAEPSSFADSFIQGSGGGVIMTKGTINLKGIYQYPPGYPVDIAYSDSQNWISRVPRRLRVMNTFANPLTNVTSVLVGCKFAYLENRKPPVKNPTERELNEDDPEISDVERRARTVSVRASSVAAHILFALGLTPATPIPFTITKVVDTWDLSAGYVQELAKIAESECYRCFINMDEQVEFISLKGYSIGTAPVIDEGRLIDLVPQTVGELPADTVFARYESLALREPKEAKEDKEDDENEDLTPEEREERKKRRRQKRNWEREESFTVEQFIHSYTADDGTEVEERGTFPAYTVTTSEYDSADRLMHRLAVKNELLGEVITETIPQYLLDAGTAASLNNEGNEYDAGPDKEDASTVVYEFNRSIAPIGNIASTCGFEGDIEQLRNMGSIFSSEPGEEGYQFSNSYVTSVRKVFFDKNKDAGVTKTVTRNFVPFMVMPFGSDEVAKMTQRLPPKIVNGQVSNAWFESVQQLMFDAISLVEYGSEVRIRTEREFGTEFRPPQQERNKQADKKNKSTDEEGNEKSDPNVIQESNIAWAIGSSLSQTALELSPPYTSDDRIVGSNGNYSVIRSYAGLQAAIYASVENRLLLAHRSGAGFQLLPIDTPPKPFDLFCVRLNGCTAAYRVNGTTWTINPTGFVCTVEGLFWGAIDGTVENAWFPLFPGATVLPAPVSVTTNASPAPANSIPMPTLFDPVNPNLTQLFTSLPTTTPPVYVAQAQPAHIIPPYHETLELTAGVQVGAGFNIQAWIPTALDLEAGVRVGGSVQAYNPVLVPSKEISIAANAPNVRIGKAIAVPSTVVTVAPEVPTIDKFTTINVPASVVYVSAIAPDKAGDASLIVTVPLATIQVAAVAPDRAGEDAVKVLVPAAVVDVAAIAPQVEVQTAGVSVPTAGAIVVAGLAPEIILGDQYFASVSLLLPFDGANGSTTFTDFSPTTKTITAFGNAQMSTAQSKYGGASALFDGSGGYIQSSISDGLNLSASDFTIEFWARFLTGGEVNQVLFQLGTTGDLYSGLMQLNNGVKVFLGSDGSSWNIAENVSVGPKVENTWVHYALTRSGSTFRAFADGVQQSTWTSSASIHQSSNGITIAKGQFIFSGRNLNAHIDDFRVTKGVARYTANFTPPTGPHPTQGPSTIVEVPSTAVSVGALVPVINPADDPTFSSNSLLIPFDGTVGSNAAPLDRSNNALTLTVGGSAPGFTISDTQFKYGQAGHFNGSARIEVPATSLLTFPGDFELQMWFYMLSRSSYSTILELGAYTNGIMIRHGSADPGVWINGNQIGGSGTTLNALSLNAWHHIALSRIGTAFKVYINGTQAHEVQVSGTINGTVGATFIGDSTHAATRFFEGYIDDFRIKKGVSTITGNFTPTGPHPLVGTPDPNFTNVSLLLPLDGENNSTTFTDFSSNNFTMTRHGNAVITTTDPKYGTGSLLLQAAGDYISTPANSAFAFGTGDFTVECHCLFTSATNNGLFAFANGLALSVFSGQWWLSDYGSGGTPMGAHMAANTWVFVRVTRSETQLKLFIDGVQIGSTLTNATNFTQNECWVGMYFSPAYTWLGKIDNFRITKGVARTDAPPVGPFPTS